MQIPPALRYPAIAIAVILSIVAGVAFVGIGVASFLANTKLFGIGVATVLITYGAALIAVAAITARGRSWALGMLVAFALLHMMVVGSFLTTTDRAQFAGSLIVAPFILATLVAGVVAIGRRDLDKVS